MFNEEVFKETLDDFDNEKIELALDVLRVLGGKMGDWIPAEHRIALWDTENLLYAILSYRVRQPVLDMLLEDLDNDE